MSVSLSKLMYPGSVPMARVFGYDQLNRLISSRAYNGVDTVNNSWLASVGPLAAYATDYSYDANGNILSLKRNGKVGLEDMDDLSYHYMPNTNRLSYVEDAVNGANYQEDVDNQLAGNYTYDAIGNLIGDVAEEIERIDWTVYGKIKKITRTVGSLKPDLEFEYSPDGHRVAKHVKIKQTGLVNSTWYVRDASGNVMATYEKSTYQELDETNLTLEKISDVIRTHHGDAVLAAFATEILRVQDHANGLTLTDLRIDLQTAGLLESGLRGLNPSELLASDPGLFDQVLTGFPPVDVVDALFQYHGSYMDIGVNLCGVCPDFTNYLFGNHYAGFTPFLFGSNPAAAQMLWDQYMAPAPYPPNDVLAANQLAAVAAGNLPQLYQEIVNMFGGCAYVMMFEAWRGQTDFALDLANYADLKSCARMAYGDFLFASLLDMRDRQFLWDKLLLARTDVQLADMLITLNPDLFARMAFTLMPTVLDQWLNAMGLTVSDYLSSVDGYVLFGAGYFDLLKETLMAQGHASNGWRYAVAEHHLYGSSRVGLHQTHLQLRERKPDLTVVYATVSTHVAFYRGKRNYELSNHLGNVMATISDKRRSVCNEELGIAYFEAEVLTQTDYYPFGSVMPNRQWSAGAEGYRYGFNGKESDSETGFQDYGFRIYDPKLGRFISVDPLSKKFPELSPFQFASNTPIWAIDLDGLEAFFIHGMRSSKDDWRTQDFQDVGKTLMKLTNNKTENYGFDWSGRGNGIFQRQVHRTRAAERLAKYVMENRVEGEEITLIGVSHGGNVAIQAAKIIKNQTGEKVNIITVNRSSHNKKGDIENPEGNEGINDLIDIRTKDDPVLPLDPSNRQGGGNNEYNGPGQKLIIKNDKIGLEKHATKNVDELQIENAGLEKLKPVSSNKQNN